MFEADMQRLKDGLVLCEKEPNFQSFNALHEHKFFEAHGAFVRFVYNPQGCYVYLYNHGQYFESGYATSHKLEDILSVTYEIIRLYTRKLEDSLADWRATRSDISVAYTRAGEGY